MKLFFIHSFNYLKPGTFQAHRGSNEVQACTAPTDRLQLTDEKQRAGKLRLEDFRIYLLLLRPRIRRGGRGGGDGDDVPRPGGASIIDDTTTDHILRALTRRFGPLVHSLVHSLVHWSIHSSVLFYAEVHKQVPAVLSKIIAYLPRLRLKLSANTCCCMNE